MTVRGVEGTFRGGALQISMQADAVTYLMHFYSPLFTRDVLFVLHIYICVFFVNYCALYCTIDTWTRVFLDSALVNTAAGVASVYSKCLHGNYRLCVHTWTSCHSFIRCCVSGWKFS